MIKKKKIVFLIPLFIFSGLIIMQINLFPETNIGLVFLEIMVLIGVFIDVWRS